MEALHPSIDPALPDVRIRWSIAEAEHAQRVENLQAAAKYEALETALAEARDFPEVFLGSELWTHGAEAGEFAVRAAAADLAVRLSMPEQTVRRMAHEAETVRISAPTVWAAFREGGIHPEKIRIVTEHLTALPPELRAAFDTAIAPLATTLTTPRFRTAAARLRERLQASTVDERHREARDRRAVWVEPGQDGMAWLTAHLPAEAAARAMARLNAHADHLAADPDDPRTRDQLRADVFSDLLTGDGTPDAVRATVAVSVPVMTLLGDGAPGSLEGVGPIDADTARRLAASAPSLQRLLTDPVRGTLLDIDRTSYRVPADLRRWLAHRDGGCRFPGCGRTAKTCELDHTTGWADGGRTSADNLMHLCRHHHRLKGESLWKLDRADTGQAIWRSPTDDIRTVDPPPF